MTGLLKRLHNTFRAYLLKHYRTKEIVRVFQVAHAQELKDLPYHQWPAVQARQSQELIAVKAGRLDIVDRKSWAWPFIPATINRLATPLMKACYSSDTEILTKAGWKKMPEMSQEDYFASLTPDGEFVWIKPQKIIKYRYRGPMINFCSKGADLLVTPNHRMYGRRVTRGWGPLHHDVMEFLPAHEVVNLPMTGNAYGFQIPLAADRWEGVLPLTGIGRLKFTASSSTGFTPNKISIGLMDYVRLIGLYLAEGSTSGAMHGMDRHTAKQPLVVQAMAASASRLKWKPKRSSMGYNVMIYQSPKSKHYKVMNTLLTNIGFVRRPKRHCWNITSKALWSDLHPLGNKYTKCIPRWIKELPTPYLKELVKWMVKGDGHVAKKRRKGVHIQEPWFMYTTVSKQLADDLIEVMQKIGWGATLEVTEPNPNIPYHGKIVHGNSAFYHVRMRKRRWQGIGKAEVIPYDDYVYCPALPPHETVFVRRNGKISWCGNTPYALRRMARTPVPRRAINLIKNALVTQPWDIQPLEGISMLDSEQEREARIRVAKKIFSHPNNIDSFQTWMEQSLEDLLIFGAMSTEIELTPDPERPIKMWAVNIESVRIFPNWSESLSADYPHYAQMTGLKGERGAVLFYDDELMYVRDNIATDTPFGTGKMEVAFRSVVDFLGVQDMSGRAGTDAVHKTWLWWEQPQSEAAYQIVRRHIQNELEGQAKISIIGGMKKPEVIEVQPTVESDLLPGWQEILIRMIGNAFDLSAMALGVEHDVNRAVGEVLDDRDHRSAVVPMGRRIAESLTTRILHNKLRWYDLEFVYLNLDDPDMVTKLDMLTRMYSSNAETPNGMRREMGKKPLDSPYADLTQFECMLINLEAQELMQLSLAEGQAKLQKKLQDEMGPPPGMPGMPGGPGGLGNGELMEPDVSVPPKNGDGRALPPGKNGKPGGSSPFGQQPPGKPGTKKMPAPQKLTLPKFPISGTKWSAREIADMPTNQLADLFELGAMPPAETLMKDMENQEPGILETLTEETKAYLEERVDKEEIAHRVKPISPKIIRKWQKEQAVRIKESRKRTSDYTTWMKKRGQEQMKQGGPGAPPVKKAGTPGSINPQLKQ